MDAVNIDNVLIDFVKKSTQHFDESHNYDHAICVTNTAHKIMKSIKGNNYNSNLLTHIAMLHDVRDHKYENSISENELEEFIKKNMGSEYLAIILLIINNISFSKEESGKLETIPEQFLDYLQCVSDADKLEALGKKGIERCKIYTISRGRKVPDDVIKHCHEKLLRLLPEGFIKTKLGRELAEPLHHEIVNYVNSTI